MFHWCKRVARGVCVTAVLWSSTGGGTVAVAQEDAVDDSVVEAFGRPPRVPTGPLSESVKEAIDVALVEGMHARVWRERHDVALATLAECRDPRVAWLIADLLRFSRGALAESLTDAASRLLRRNMADEQPWRRLTDHLIAWDIPAPPDYLQVKRTVFTQAVPGWDALFVPGAIDWRHVSWGGVLIDDRASDQTDASCRCIPAADDPEVTTAEAAEWLDDDDIVFGVAVGDAYRAYPRQIMEVREMVNDTLGGRRLGLPYCTLCGSMQAYYTDEVDEDVRPLTLRTTGLLIRSNKVMYDLGTDSLFDTFLGTAVTGPLYERGVRLNHVAVVTTTWGAWKTDHPDTTVVHERYALGRDYDFRSGRDANGPIFPIGDVDPRLPVQHDVLGVLTGAGEAVAFPRDAALRSLRRGEPVGFGAVHLVLDGDGLRAVDADGTYLGSHEAFWFAWSQFHPDTTLWSPPEPTRRRRGRRR